MLEYWKRPDATAKVLRGDWLYTGDVGYMDDDGYLYLVDRIKDVIITGGYKVFPSVVKSAIEQHPAVEEVAVVGVPHPHWGQIVTAFVVPSVENSLTQDDIIVYLRDRLSSYEMPKRVHFMKALPKSPVGKILKTELIESCGS